MVEKVSLESHPPPAPELELLGNFMAYLSNQRRAALNLVSEEDANTHERIRALVQAVNADPSLDKPRTELFRLLRKSALVSNIDKSGLANPFFRIWSDRLHLAPSALLMSSRSLCQRPMNDRRQAR